MKLPYFRAEIVMEGGAIECNGKGIVLTTKSCLLNKNRNKNSTKQEIEKKLIDFLGASKVIWLEKGFKNDHTDGHIDNLARFVNENTILCSFEENKKGQNYNSLKKNYDELRNAKDTKGRKFKIVRLPVPKFFSKRKRLDAGYTNFYIANNAVLVPQFNDAHDLKALKIISKFFPKRKIIGIDCTQIIFGGGTIHCITQQQPSI